MQTDMWGADSEWFWALMQFIAVAVTLVLIYFQMRMQTSSHVVQVLTTIESRWNSESFLRARGEVCRHWISKKREFDGIAEFVAEFMEELGTYLRIHAVPAREMWGAQSWYIEHYYWMFKEGIDQVRRKYKDPNLYTEFEMLYGRMNDLNRKHRSPAFPKEEEEITAFAQSEIDVADAIIRLKSEGTVAHRVIQGR